MSFVENIQEQFRKGDSVMRILLINIAVFILIALYQLVLFLTESLPPALLNEDLGLAANSSWRVMLFRPWSIITHMFTHVNFGHFFFNMIALYALGNMFISIMGSRRLLPLYLMGGLSGYILFAVVYSLSDVLGNQEAHAVLGASAAVMAIVVAIAVIRPLQKIFLFGIVQLELRWLALILVLLDLASIKDGVNSGGHIGHLGGAIFGLIYGSRFNKGVDMGSWLNKIFEKIKGTFSRKKMTVAKGHTRPKSDEQYNLEKKQRQQKIDNILDKISRSGYDSLSKEEKDFLFRNSEK
jgi:membrane associated rhomboid family serine protease